MPCYWLVGWFNGMVDDLSKFLMGNATPPLPLYELQKQNVVEHGFLAIR